MTPHRIEELEAEAQRVREHIIRLSGRGGCFIGASLSCADLVVYLYREYLHIEAPDSPDRDFLFLSKGHDVPALYGQFVEMGQLEEGRLKDHLSPDDDIYWHPNRAIPGIEFHSGSLGHLLAVAVGVAYDLKITGAANRVVVITGDGELDEGSNWESLLVAAAYELDNLVVVVDRNAFQANIETEHLIPLEPLEDKFRAFGAAEVRRCDGHSFEALADAFDGLPVGEGPSVVIADTVRGRGLPSIERRADRWFVRFTDAEVEELLAELHGEGPATLTSETLIVR